MKKASARVFGLELVGDLDGSEKDGVFYFERYGVRQGVSVSRCARVTVEQKEPADEQDSRQGAKDAS